MLITRSNAKSMVVITLSALLMAISLSCQNETKIRSDRVSLSEAFLLSEKHQARYDLVGDSLYEVGAISSVMRDFLHGLSASLHLIRRDGNGKMNHAEKMHAFFCGFFPERNIP